MKKVNVKLLLIFLFGIFCIFESANNPNIVNLFFIVVGIATIVMFATNLLSMVKDFIAIDKEIREFK